MILKERLQNVSPEVKLLFFRILRELVKKQIPEFVSVLGLEKTEEIIVSLIDKGKIKVVRDNLGDVYLEFQKT